MHENPKVVLLPEAILTWYLYSYIECYNVIDNNYFNSYWSVHEYICIIITKYKCTIIHLFKYEIFDSVKINFYSTTQV